MNELLVGTNEIVRYKRVFVLSGRLSSRVPVYLRLIFISLFSLSRYSRDTDSGDVNSRNHHMLKCGALILFSVLLGAMAAMNFSLAFFVAMFHVPVYLFVIPTPSR